MADRPASRVATRVGRSHHGARAWRPHIGARGALAVAGAVLVGAVVVAVLRSGTGDRVAAAVAYGTVVGMPMAVGLLAWRAQPDERFARLLVAAGAVAALSAFSESAASVPYSIGRVAVWFVVPVTLSLMLVFPSGRLPDRRDRRLVVILAALVGSLYLPTALISSTYPTPTPWASCVGGGCPSNAFALVSADPALLDPIRIVREVITTIVVLAVAVRLAQRARGAAGLLRRALVPVVVVAVFQVVAFAGYQWARRRGAVSDGAELLGWAWLYSLPAVAASFAVGLLSRRLYVARAIQRLTWDLRAPAGPHELRASLARVLEDPRVRVVYWFSGEPGGWVDESGRAVAAPAAEQGEAVTEVHADGRRIAAVVHEASLGPDSRLVQAAASYGLVVLENTRLIEELRRSRERLSESERDRATAAAHERERIERDLHDGAQQRLVALRIKLAALSSRLGREAPERAAELDTMAIELEHATEELRTLARAIAPPLLAEAGLAAALREATRGAPLVITVRDEGIGRYSPQVEKTVYFACLEATQNAVKHAAGATGVAIALSADGALHFEVSDDGPGFGDGARRGSGLPNMAARVASVGGGVSIVSAPGHGTQVVGTIPLE